MALEVSRCRRASSFGSVVAAWLAIGLVLSIVMERRRHDEQLRPRTLAGRVPVTAGTGPIDVLVGYDGSSEADGAPQAVVDLLGDRLGRLTVATVIPFGGLEEQEQDATELLRRLARRLPGRMTELEVVHGHPSVALRQCATEGGYKLIAVGTRGAGLSKAIRGSAASELPRESEVPVLFVGSVHPGATTTIMDERHVVSVQVADGAGGIHGSPLKRRTSASMAGMSCLRVVDR